MQALKIMVVVMGVLIVAGVAVIATDLARRASSGRAAPAASAGASLAGFDEKTVELPKNGRLTGVHTEAGRVVLRVLLPGNKEMLIVLDLATGERLGTINVNPAP